MTEELIHVTQWGELAQLYQAGGVPMPFVKDIFLLECDVAGCSFVPDVAGKIFKICKSTELRLIREPENKYDDLAIRVENQDGEKIGYIPRKQNPILARLMDGGKQLYAKMVNLEFYHNTKWADLTIKVYLRDL